MNKYVAGVIGFVILSLLYLIVHCFISVCLAKGRDGFINPRLLTLCTRHRSNSSERLPDRRPLRSLSPPPSQIELRPDHQTFPKVIVEEFSRPILPAAP